MAPSVRALLEALPPHLSERVAPLGPEAIGGGTRVLYWMHHAVRDHENPALDVAVELAARLGRPLLVYQGLGGAHRFASDRHHAFVLEGVRDLARGLQAQGLVHVLHLDGRTGRRDGPGPLAALAADSALVVTEDLPVPPFAGWAERLAARAAVPVLRVDTACVVPFRRLAATPYDGLDAFRAAQRVAGLEARIMAPWPERTASAEPDRGPLPFEPAALDGPVAELVARCAIDHGVGPIPEVPGGSAAGYARWARFREEGLAHYHEDRGDPLALPPRGTSGLRPYLHHGQVSPFTIAREAAAESGPGRDAFLESLTGRRELAHQLCAALGADARLEGLDALPEWARDSLRAHARDPRRRRHDVETLRRGATGDALWDAAQAQLRVHGGLHAAVRTTWAQALLEWRADPEDALRVALELDRRFALDGGDPTAFVAVLGAFGLLQTPAATERPILGAVPHFGTAEHARRLDVPEYEARARRPARAQLGRVVVVGAGVAGAVAARSLADHGLEVIVVDKGRGPGGRTSTRRQGELTFDHGAQYFTARDPRLQRAVESWVEAGVVAPWTGRVVRLGPDGASEEAEPEERWVGVPGMNAIARHLLEGLDLRTGATVKALVRDRGRWRVELEAGAPISGADAVLLTVPPPQAVPLLGPASPLVPAARARVLAPCWAVMLALDTPSELPFDGAFVRSGPLAWVARDSSKPGRRASPETWVLHASVDWTRAELERPPEAVVEALLAAFVELGARLPAPPRLAVAHRWRYARPEGETGDAPAFDAERRIGLAGDAWGGPRVEAAWCSGLALAGRLLGQP